MKRPFSIIFSVAAATLLSATSYSQETKFRAPCSFDEINTTDFPYLWKYKDQAEDFRDSSNLHTQTSISIQEATQVLSHPLCKSLESILKDDKKREELLAKTLSIAIKKPAIASNSVWQVLRMVIKKPVTNSAVQEQNDKAMALYNCAMVYQMFGYVLAHKDAIDIILSSKGNK